ncbi:MAG: hypothetical protein SCH70_00850 [Candidatus Methanoperedens sp.]|nr:hypothetical protein [Candidatus Methanoperedens sp.]
MSLKRMTDNESGITYTLEAIIGVLLIIGTIVYLTGNIPYTAQKTGEHSKVQLMNIGRDNLDLTFITPIQETCPGCMDIQVPRQYLLLADKEFVKPYDTVNFTVTYANGDPVNKWLTLQNTTLGTGDPFKNMTEILNTATWSWSASPENLTTFSIRANDFAGGVSNIVTIKVGWYFLDSNTGGIYSDNDNVTGVVRYPNGTGAPNLSIFLYGPLKDKGQGICESGGIAPQAITDETGYFSFGWPDNFTTGGLYYVYATDSNLNSNKHLIIYSKSGGGGTLWVYGTNLPYPGSNQTITIMELDTAYLYSDDMNINNLNNLYINNEEYNNSDPSYSFYLNNGTLEFTANLAGDYYIYFHSGAANCQGQGPVKTNGVLIQVLPIIPPTGQTQDNCFNGTELNKYMLNYTPPNVNYNLYLIDPTGNRFTGCPDLPEGQVINGYPTAEAVTVNKLAHIKYATIDKIVEYRIVLWYR